MNEGELLTIDQLIAMAVAHLDLIDKYDPQGMPRDELRDIERTWAMIAQAAATTAQAKMQRETWYDTTEDENQYH